MENENKNELNFTKLRFWIILILLLIGIALCSELAVIFYKTNFLPTFNPSFCAVSELIDCDGVALTEYSLSFGVPNAIWGLLVYSVMLMLLFVDRIQRKFKNTIFDVFEHPQAYIATIGLLTFLLSMILAGISIFKIHKICTLCFGTYLIDLLIAFTAKGKGFFIQDVVTTIQDFIKGAKKYFVLFIIVLVAFVSTIVYLDRSVILSPKIKKERTMKEFFEAKFNKYAIKDNTLGKEKSKVKITVYTDFNCPFCRIFNMMLHKAARERNIFVEEINYPIDMSCNNSVGITLGGHENSCILAKYALAARKQGKFWGAANVFFDQHPVTEDEIISQLKDSDLKLDLDKLKADANSKEIEEELQNDIKESAKNNIYATPSMNINGTPYVGGMPYEELLEKIDLAKKELKK